MLPWLFVACTGAAADAPLRPMIWVTSADRTPILAKIETQPWARTVFTAMQDRVKDSVAAHRRDPDAFLRRLPLVADPAQPGRHPTLARVIRNVSDPDGDTRGQLHRYILTAVDCGVLHFLTGDAAYARCAGDILHATVSALVQMPVNESTTNGGWIFPEDHLYEARGLGAQIPVIYDFIAAHLRTGATVYDLAARGPVPFDFARAQQVFRTYARLAIEHGIIDANWPVLEMPSLAHNVLALDDPAERARLLRHVTDLDTPHQDSLKKVVAEYAQPGAIWPESLQYSGGVSSLATYLVALLRRQEPPAPLPAAFAHIPLSLSRLRDFRFPNGEFLRFGDGPRRSGSAYASYEIAYALAQREGDTALQATFGALINLGLSEGKYDRAKPLGHTSGASAYLSPLQLLWNAPTVSGTMVPPPPRTTDDIPFAGVVLQRNLSPAGDPAHALMAVVSGAAFVHSHASGMALELYGAGQVLGANAGKGAYTTDDHENHRRLFAAHNGVIVNGASRSNGGWVNLGIDTVRPVALEPAVGAAPVSPHHSFTLTRFTDISGDDVKAEQERLVGLVRTSATTGYYVDVFRSRTAQAEQFHDYLYHNLGDALTLTAAGQPLTLADAPDRFRPAAGTTWSRNRTYLFPGWHVFKTTRASTPFAADVAADFNAAKLKPAPAAMRLFIPGAADREYASALAPETKEAPSPYDKLPTPVLVIRQSGEAWDRPFAVIYEPSAGGASAGSIRSVAALRQNGEFCGFTLTSLVAGRTLTQFILTLPTADSEFSDATLGLTFRGRYAVVTLGENQAPASLYVGDGTRLGFHGHVITAHTAAYADFGGAKPALTAPGASATLTLPDGRRLSSRSD
ncbi:MAG: heparinase II/III family protein [Opitutaceae bacterium]|nr:heparinase II/III family protein [Opitutaceae bacterium]